MVGNSGKTMLLSSVVRDLTEPVSAKLLEEEPSNEGRESAKSGGVVEPAESVEVAPVPLAPRMTSIAPFTYIYERAARQAPLGYLHVGASIALRRPDPLRRPGCTAGWYAVEPKGFICNDNTTVRQSEHRQLTPGATRLVRGLEVAAPARGPLPYGYALSAGAPMYGRLPSESEQEQNEWMYGPRAAPLGRWARGHDGLVDPYPPFAESQVPWFVANGDSAPVNVRGDDPKLIRKLAPRGSMISFGKAFEARGRTWLVTPDLSLVPADRVHVYRPSTFHGVELGESLSLPIAWIRKQPRPRWKRGGEGKLVLTEQKWPTRTAVGLTGKRVSQDGRELLETTELGVYIDEDDATVVERRVSRPNMVGPDEKWIRVSITRGTLTAYVGDNAVFATLVSPGRGGPPRGPFISTRELSAKHNTPIGTFRVQYKDRYTVMSPDPEQKKYFISDVPYVQYFSGPFALHAAFWHEEFGEPKSGGCVNVSPDDALRLFSWTDPPVPDAWQGARSGGSNGQGTVVEIVR
ncbi:MAG TPA: L,D-transpeptidase [Polyangiaceae bacterium]|nr:L,D-transpeptidase [Polyangiaceae bacterium]